MKSIEEMIQGAKQQCVPRSLVNVEEGTYVILNEGGQDAVVAESADEKGNMKVRVVDAKGDDGTEVRSVHPNELAVHPVEILAMTYLNLSSKHRRMFHKSLKSMQ